MGIKECLKIKKRLLNQIFDYCKKELPHEACGIIAMKNDKVVKIYRIANIKESPFTYHFDSRQQFQAMKDIEQNGWELGGFFHSHVNSDAYPSETDLKQAFYPDVVYLIVSLKDVNKPLANAFLIRNEEVIKTDYEVVE